MSNPDRPAKPVRRRKRRWGWMVLLLIVVVGAGLYAWRERPWEPKPKIVATEILAPGVVSQVLAVNGRVAAETSVTVRAAVSATALSVAVREGDTVRQGDMLVQLDSALANAQLEQAQAALEAQQVRQKQAEANADRFRALGDNSPRSALEDAELALAGAINETTRLQAALEESRRQVGQYRLVAPMDGVVLSRGVDPGQLVDPQTQLFVIADTSTLVVETDVDELYSSRMAEGLKALLKPVGASVSQAGEVIFAAPSVDSSTGGRAIKIGFAEKVALPVGLTVNANVVVEEVADALSVPRGAIVTEGTESHVLVVAEGKAEIRPIDFSDWPAERVIVTAGLAAGDRVILDPASVKPGDLVAAE